MSRHPLAASTAPHDVDAEASVLGGILLRNEILSTLSALEVEDFYSPKHQAVFTALRNLESKLAPLDRVTVAGELERMGRLEAVGGEAFLGDLELRTPSVENTEHYAKILGEHRLSRDVMRACSDVLEDIRTGQMVGEEAISVAVRHLMDLQQRVPDVGNTVDDLMQTELDAVDRDMQALDRGEAISVGMPTGIETLDQETGGYPIGSVSVVLGATGHGKSTLIFTGARAASAQGDLALIYSFEDPKKFWAQRALAQESGVPTEAIARRRNLGPQLRRLATARVASKRRTEWVIPAAQWTVDDLIRDVQARRVRDRAKAGKKRRCAVFADYIQVFRFHVERNGNREQAIAAAMDRLAWLAQGCGSKDSADECAVIVGSQVKQKVVDEKRAPRMDDGADSFSIAKTCKYMLGINRPAKYDPDANRLAGSVDVLKRNQGDDEVHADVVLNLATHTITASGVARQEPQAALEGLGQ